VIPIKLAKGDIVVFEVTGSKCGEAFFSDANIIFLSCTKKDGCRCGRKRAMLRNGCEFIAVSFE
jgi:hypothetical protein